MSTSIDFRESTLSATESGGGETGAAAAQDEQRRQYPDSDTDTSSVGIIEEMPGPNAQRSLSVLDVAAYILGKTGEISTMKLQKLVYYCQAWSLVWDEVPLFQEPIEAWANGPVVRKLFNYHRGQYRIRHVLTGNPRLLTPEQRETADAVLEFYGKFSAQELVDRSHADLPWIRAREGMDPMERGKRRIELDSIQEYFSTLAAS